MLAALDLLWCDVVGQIQANSRGDVVPSAHEKARSVAAAFDHGAGNKHSYCDGYGE